MVTVCCISPIMKENANVFKHCRETLWTVICLLWLTIIDRNRQDRSICVVVTQSPLILQLLDFIGSILVLQILLMALFCCMWVVTMLYGGILKLVLACWRKTYLSTHFSKLFISNRWNLMPCWLLVYLHNPDRIWLFPSEGRMYVVLTNTLYLLQKKFWHSDTLMCLEPYLVNTVYYSPVKFCYKFGSFGNCR